MSFPGVGAALALLNVLVLLGLLAIEARLALAGERKLAAGVSGLAVLAAVTLLLCLALLGGPLLRWLRETGPGARLIGPPEPSLEAKGGGRRP